MSYSSNSKIKNIFKMQVWPNKCNAIIFFKNIFYTIKLKEFLFFLILEQDNNNNLILKITFIY